MFKYLGIKESITYIGRSVKFMEMNRWMGPCFNCNQQESKMTNRFVIRSRVMVMGIKMPHMLINLQVMENSIVHVVLECSSTI